MEAHGQSATLLYQHISDYFPGVWQQLSLEIPDNPWVSKALAEEQTLTWSILLVTNPEIHQLNQEFRHKDSATDVLTFTLTETDTPLPSLPEVNLGEIYLSIDWAKEAICKDWTPPLNFCSPLTLYILERMVHGCLHLLGVHHDTMADYHHVVAIQQKVLASLD